LLGERVEHVAPAPVFAFLYLMVFCTMAAYVAYGYLIRHTSPIIASSCMYVNPIVAVALGALMLGEPVTTATVIATVAILGSVGLSFLFDPARRPAARAASVGAHADANPISTSASIVASAADAAVASMAASAPESSASAQMPDAPPMLTPSAVPIAVPAPAAVVAPEQAFAPPPADEPAAPRADA
jgi:hypothetical protein